MSKWVRHLRGWASGHRERLRFWWVTRKPVPAADAVWMIADHYRQNRHVADHIAALDLPIERYFTHVLAAVCEGRDKLNYTRAEIRAAMGIFGGAHPHPTIILNAFAGSGRYSDHGPVLPANLEASLREWAHPVPDIDPKIVPDACSYQWVRESLLGVADTENMHRFKANHWKPVPRSRHPKIPSDEKKRIVASGAVLMQRPKYLADEARAEDLEMALNQARFDKTNRAR